MIVSFSRKFVFVAVPKTAGHAVRTWLRTALAPDDWEQSTLFEKRLFPVPALAAIGHGHVTCRQIAPWLLPGMWDSFFTFGVVRDPFERFRSYCAFVSPGIATSEDPLDEMKRLWERAPDRVLLRPQHDFLCDADGAIAVDLVARHERLQRDMGVVAERIGIAAAPLPRINVPPARVDTPFDAELRGMIADRYARDFDLFDYDPDRRG